MNFCNITLVVPPWTIIETPNLGVHLIQAYAKKKNIDISVFYADQLFAKKIGLEKYHYLSESLVSQYELLQERLFAKAAYPEMPFLGRRMTSKGPSYLSPRSKYNEKINWESLYALENKINEWVNEVGEMLANSNSKIIGFSISHQQNNSSIALINKIKNICPEKIIIVGGSNCDGNMAKGILSLTTNIDYAFSGKSEVSFVKAIKELINKNYFPKKIIPSISLLDLNSLVTPNYDDYFTQCKENNFNELTHWLNVESSRGCWWGKENQCKFCGVNGSEYNYYYKSPDKIYKEILYLTEKYGIKNVRMVDTLMPQIYFKSLLPKLKNMGLNIFYEQRANINLEKMIALKMAGINYIQIGIESLSGSQLKLINKGCSVMDNINSLRFTSMCGINIGWNLLYDIPNDSKEEWKNLLELIPLIKHLPAPSYLRPVELARFSPYHSFPEKYGITNLRHFDVYNDIFPKNADFDSLAWLFTGDYDCSSRKDLNLISLVQEEVDDWIETWKSDRIHLTILSKDESLFLIDTRKLSGVKKIQEISKEQASVVIMGKDSTVFKNYYKWCISNKLLIIIDNDIIPLTTCSIEMYNYLKEDYEEK